MKKTLLILFLLPCMLWSQEDLLAKLDSVPMGEPYETAVFKALKIVNFESTKMVPKTRLYFVVSHRFGSISSGLGEFFGLDQAVTRLNFVYGVTDGINLGISRSSFEKTYEASAKFRLIRQREGGSPWNLVMFNSLMINGFLDRDNLPGLEFKHRLSYALQALISRKMGRRLSLELAPTFFHDNLVALQGQDNAQFALGFGGRYKISKRVSLNADYGLHLNRTAQSPFNNPLSVGVDIETGGHVFQLHFTNAQPMNVNGFLSQATGDWGKADVYFGFNLLRIF